MAAGRLWETVLISCLKRVSEKRVLFYFGSYIYDQWSIWAFQPFIENVRDVGICFTQGRIPDRGLKSSNPIRILDITQRIKESSYRKWRTSNCTKGN